MESDVDTLATVTQFGRMRAPVNRGNEAAYGSQSLFIDKVDNCSGNWIA